MDMDQVCPHFRSVYILLILGGVGSAQNICTVHHSSSERVRYFTERVRNVSSD